MRIVIVEIEKLLIKIGCGKAGLWDTVMHSEFSLLVTVKVYPANANPSLRFFNFL